MIRKFRRIFRSPSTSTTIKTELNHQTSSLDSTPDDTSNNKQGSSNVTNRLYTGNEKKKPFSFLFIFFSHINICTYVSIEIIYDGKFVF